MNFKANTAFSFLVSALFATLFGIMISEVHGIENNVKSSKNQFTQIGSIGSENVSIINETSSRLTNSSIILANISSLQWTGSIKVNGELDAKALGRIKVDMCLAGMTSEKAVGVHFDPMQSNTSAKLTVENGYLVYRVGVTDGDNKYIVFVDPANGDVLNIQPTDVILDTGMSMMYKCMDPSSNQTATPGGNGMAMIH